jgi:hypothetical protein
MTAPSKKTEREIIDEMMASWEADSKDPVKQEEARREEEEERRNEFREEFIQTRLFNGWPHPSPFEIELHDLLYGPNLTEEFYDEVISPIRRLHEHITELMYQQGELAEEQILEFKNNAKVPPLVDAVERNLTPEQFLEIYKATPLEHLSEAIKQYRQAV